MDHEGNEQYSLLPAVRETLEAIHGKHFAYWAIYFLCSRFTSIVDLHKNFLFMGQAAALFELFDDFNAYLKQEIVISLIEEKQMMVFPSSS